ncbi:class I SAM-dependent methyltransferase [Dactylosporangium sp. NPDC000555]|uniref:O-methyltransferase n=1 Tax=Dactylosporangium sp. NPDC000555 TaxID=3154260 RepID=UPI0033311F64
MNLIDSAYARAEANGFGQSCEPPVGRLLATLAAALPPGARVLEIGTGAGAGTAWLASGLLPRTDVSVVSVELDPAISAIAAQGEWPAFVELRVGDALEFLAAAEGGFDLIFADAMAGKSEGIEHTLARLNPRGTLVVDDMRAVDDWPDAFKVRQDLVRRTLLDDPGLVCVELEHGTGVIIGVRRPPTG